MSPQLSRPQLWYGKAVRALPFGVMLLALVGPVQRTVDQGFRDLGIDGHVYYSGAAAWLAGQDPWNAAYRGLHFASPPWTLVMIWPMTLRPASVAVAILIALDVVASVYLVWRSGLPLYWVLFPPLVYGTVNANPAIVALALVVAGVGPLGLLLRPQLGFALVGERRWRAIAVTAVLAVALLPILPWATYVADFATLSARYITEGFGGTTGGSVLALVVGLVAVLAIAAVDDREAGWLATIVVVPLNGWYAGAAAILFINPLLAMGLAPAVVGMPTATVAVYAMLRVSMNRWPEGRLRWLVEPFVAPYRRQARRSTANPSVTPDLSDVTRSGD